MWTAAFSKGFYVFGTETLLIIRILDALATIKGEPRLPVHPGESGVQETPSDSLPTSEDPDGTSIETKKQKHMQMQLRLMSYASNWNPSISTCNQQIQTIATTIQFQ
jgi:hypothetical protein